MPARMPARGTASTGFRRDVGIYEAWIDLKAKLALEGSYFRVFVQGKRLFLAKAPLYIFREDWPAFHTIRVAAIWITEWKWFERVIIMVIAMNCVTLALPVAYDPESATLGEREALLICNVITMMIFTSECILKIISRGLILSNAPDCCYLREPMNWLDLAVVTTSILELFVLDDQNSESKGVLLVRTLRVLRPLRTIQVLPSLRIIVNALVESAPMILHWLIFTSMFLVMLATAGMNLFGTIYWQRCRLTPAPVPAASGGFEWVIDPMQPRFCGGRQTCAPAPSGQPTYCASPVEVGGQVPSGMDPWSEISTNPGADFGYSGFQTFGTSLLTTFQVSTLDGWTELLYRYQDGAGTLIAVLFFTGVVLFSGLLLLNMAPAILWERFSCMQNTLISETLRRQNGNVEAIPEDILSMKLWELIQKIAERDKELDQNKVNQQVNDLTGIGIKPVCLWMCSRPWFENFFLFLVIVNAVMLSTDSYPAMDPIVVGLKDYINLICSFLFIVEVSIKLIGKGVYFWADHLNVFDFVLVAISMVEILQKGTGTVSALRTARLLRILSNDLFGVNVAKRVLLRVLKKAIVPTCSFAVVVIACLYCLALLGLQLFFPRVHSQMATASSFPRFDSILYALISVFTLVTGDDWSRGMVQHTQGSNEASEVVTFHVLVLVFSRLVLMSFLLAIFAGCFAQARDELLIECRREVAKIREGTDIPQEQVEAEGATTPAPKVIDDDKKDEPEPDSPIWPKDILQSREAPTKIDCRGMNVFRMMRIKRACFDRQIECGGAVTYGTKTSRKFTAEAVQAAENLGKQRAKTPGGVYTNDSELEGYGRARSTRVSTFTEPVHGTVPPSPRVLPAGKPRTVEPWETGTPRSQLGTPRGAEKLAVRRPCIPLLHLGPEKESALGVPAFGTLGLRRRARQCSRREGFREPDFRELVRSAREEAERPLELAAPWCGVLAEVERRPPAAARTPSPDQRQRPGRQDSPPPAVDREDSSSLLWPPRRREAVAAHGAPPPLDLPIHGQEGASSSRPKVSTRTSLGSLNEALGHAVGEVIQRNRAGSNPDMSHDLKFFVSTEEEDQDAEGRIPNSSCSSRAFLIVTSPIFEPVVLTINIISNICLACETPYQAPSGTVGIMFATVDVVTVGALTTEMVLKALAFGLFTKPSGYFRSVWNWIDFVAAVTWLVDIVFRLLSMKAPGGNALKLLRSFRVLRVLRPFRFATGRYRGIQILVEALLTSVPTLLNVVLILFFFYLGVGILLVNILKGQLWHCSLDPTGELRPDIVTRGDCLAAGGEWVNAPSNFDHIGHAMVTLIHIGTGEGWIDVMLSIINSVGVDHQPRPSNSVHLSLVVIAFVALSRFVLLNLFIGVLIDSYTVAKHELDGIDSLSWDERRWHRMQLNVFFNPRVVLPPEARLKGERWLKQRQFIQPIVESKPFEAVLLLCILGNAVSACAIYPLQSEYVLTTCQAAAVAFNLFITLEVSLKAVVHQIAYFKDPWHLMAIVVAAFSDVSAFVDAAGISGGWFARCLRVFRVMRLLRFAKKARFQRALLQTLHAVLPGLAHVVFLLSLVLFMFACMGVGLFGTVSNGDALGSDANFNGFFSAVLLLIRAGTGEKWHMILHDLVNDKPGCVAETQSPEDLALNGPRGCGSPFAYPFFLVFLVMVSTMLYFIVAVVLDAFYEVYQIYSMKKFEILVSQLSKAWKQKDDPFTSYLGLDDAVNTLMEVEQPVGYAGSGCSKKHVVHQMRYIRLYAGRKVCFRDVVALSARRSILWLRGGFENEIYTVQFEADIFQHWVDTFAGLPVPRMEEAVPQSPKSPSSMAHKLSGRAMRGLRSARKGGHRGESPSEKSDEHDGLSQITGHAIATAAALDDSFELLIGHLIVAMAVSNLITRKRRMWKKNLGRRPSQILCTTPTQIALAMAIQHHLKVSIVSAQNLRKADWFGSSDSYCKCTILGNERHWIQTHVVTSVDPEWHFEGELPHYHEGESLLFEVLDADTLKDSDFLGRAVLSNADFFPHGFEGELKLQDTGEENADSRLQVKVELLPQEPSTTKPKTSERGRAKKNSKTEDMKGDPSAVPQPNVLCTELLPLSFSKFRQLSPLPWPPPLPTNG